MITLEAYFPSEDDCLSMIQEAVHDASNDEFRQSVVDPIIKVLETSSGRNKYVDYGDAFLESNALMLAKEYPTKAVSFPRRYVDNLFELFGFELKTFKSTLHDLIRKHVSATNNFQTLLENPSNVIHTVALYYSDMTLNRKLRDSARQQLGLSVYHNMFAKYYPKGCNEQVMAYTYMNLDGSWNIVKSEDMITWIGQTIETVYGCWRTKLSLNISILVTVKFLNGVRNAFNQSMRLLTNKYMKNIEANNMVGTDSGQDDEHLVTNNFITLRENLMRMIKNGDPLYKTNGVLYSGISRLKNVKAGVLFDFAQKVSSPDISRVIDNILYVFLVKEHNTIEDINSTKYIGRITNMPTAIDRAIQGKPIIIPYTKKYKASSEIVKAFICLVATFILKRVDDAKK